MTSNDIAVPDLSYYIEHDRLQDALREVHEDGQNGEVPSLSLTTVTTSTAQSATTSRVPLAAPKKPKKRPKKKRKKTSEPLPPRRRTPKKFLSPVGIENTEALITYRD